jgi:cytochrome P450
VAGPIVRITPWELHVDEPDFYEVLYSRDSPRDKYKFYANMFGHPEAMIAALDHNRHRMLRANMNPYFSMRRIRSLEPDIQALVKKLVSRLNDFKGTGTPLTIQYPFTCYSTDTITSYTMGSGFQYLDDPDFCPDWSITLSSFAKMSAVLKPMPWIGKLMDSLPQALVTKMNPGMALMFAWQARCHAIIQSVLDAYRKGELKQESQTRPTFFHDIVTSELPEREKTEERLAQELQIVVAAGAETVAKFLSWTTYFLLENPEKLEKLKEELNRLDPDRTATLVELENMPYLVSGMTGEICKLTSIARLRSCSKASGGQH